MTTIKIKVSYSSRAGLRQGAHLLFLGHWARRWVYHWVCDAWPAWRLTYGYLPSLIASPREITAGCKSDALTTIRHYATPNSHDWKLFIIVYYAKWQHKYMHGKIRKKDLAQSYTTNR